VIPLNAGWAIADINVGILYIFAISSLGVYGVIMGGWASNSKYPFLGALRSAAQMVSYEVSIGFVIVTVLMCAGTLNLSGSWSRRTRASASSAGTGCRSFPCSWCSSSRPWPRRTARPSTFRRPNPSSWRLHGRVFLDPLPALHARRVRGHHDHVRAGHDPVPGRLAVADPFAPFTWIRG
jgi:hypothetical protein